MQCDGFPVMQESLPNVYGWVSNAGVVDVVSDMDGVDYASGEGDMGGETALLHRKRRL